MATWRRSSEEPGRSRRRMLTGSRQQERIATALRLLREASHIALLREANPELKEARPLRWASKRVAAVVVARSSPHKSEGLQVRRGRSAPTQATSQEREETAVNNSAAVPTWLAPEPLKGWGGRTGTNGALETYALLNAEPPSKSNCK
ncbi:hypothetical protein NDU88_003433 [Pleurodeles waltl]|uniref:Uncharacterized protein n=1 Tax=Pleurodeles waltl TaxID=8319 RepID=A0AAV7UC25_PLEWA|nr:hypothetical protein NDU88_003433 [Pleurodeles waltl]